MRTTTKAARDSWVICPGCSGEGTCVNPSIDCNGLTQEDFDEDPDFAENYFGGLYDVSCAACEGTGKIRRSHLATLRERAADRRLAAMEAGESPSGLGDYRFG